MVLQYFKKWTPLRYIRLVLAFFVFAQSITSEMWILIIPGLYLAVQALFNFGCNNASCKL